MTQFAIVRISNMRRDKCFGLYSERCLSVHDRDQIWGSLDSVVMSHVFLSKIGSVCASKPDLSRADRDNTKQFLS